VPTTSHQSVCYPVGIAENIPVKIRNFFVLVDFVVLDMQEHTTPPPSGRDKDIQGSSSLEILLRENY